MSSLLERLKRVRIVRAFVYAIVGAVSYPGLVWVNRLKISGTENIKNLPPRTVLFVSNHQTYFADVITFLHIFYSVKWGKKNRLGILLLSIKPVYQCLLCSCRRNDERKLDQPFLYAGGGVDCKTYLAC